MPKGTYMLTVSAKAADQSAISSTVVGVGVVREIDMSNMANPTLSVSGRVLGMGDILGLKN
jgi:hypothetical protein